jgi:hypothetical protein
MSHINREYEELAATLAFAAVLAVGAPPEPAPGLKGINIVEDDPVRGTWRRETAPTLYGPQTRH